MERPNWPTRFGYTGQVYLPGAKLSHYKARAYDPAVGRFLQTDPIGYDDGPNLYAYVGGDPVNRTDPSGLCRFQLHGNSLWTQRSWGLEFLGNEFSHITIDCDPIEARARGRESGGSGGGLPQPPITQSRPTRSMSTSTTRRACQTPQTPPGTNISRNVRLAAARGRSMVANVGNYRLTVANLGWFYNQVNTGHGWDFKTGGSVYIDAGNFNYGATGTAMGLSRSVLYAGAGFAQVRDGNSSIYFANTSFDDPLDRPAVDAGIAYARAKCAQ